MKLCQKCVDSVKAAAWAHFIPKGQELIEPSSALEVAPEPECEFWAHEELNLYVKTDAELGYEVGNYIDLHMKDEEKKKDETA
jgi:hypothetical protein